MTSTFKENILGAWTRTENTEIKHGTAIETFYQDGTKMTQVFIASSNEPIKTINARSTWKIVKNTLTEKVIDIDKEFSVQYGIKTGFVVRSYISHLDENVLTVKNLNNKHVRDNATTFKRFIEQ